ncbi:hypothetical protein [Brachybacterium sp. NPDC056505]|uniref:hypothetical protein n=1 Tax=Brachybacterium sp. NPDC056505 TaxID=3345843 RepID=UPI003672C70D
MAKKDEIFIAGAAGTQIVCGHCEGNQFRSRRVLLNSGTSELFGFAAFSPEAIALACVKCGKMQEFEDGRVELVPVQD